MSQTQAWAFPESLQPKAEQSRFDLTRALDSIVLVRALVPEDAFTARVLGTERGGQGVVIREDGLVLTIGYLITEATTIWLTTNRGDVVPGWPLVYDQATGFGLIQPLAKLATSWLERGSIKDIEVGSEATVIGHGGRSHSLVTRIIDKREFAGYWEYLLDEALFTSPAHPEWSGAPLLDANGKLIGIGSLLLQQEIEKQQVHTNMFVPIDLLEPILDDLAGMLGSSEAAPSRPQPQPQPEAHPLREASGQSSRESSIRSAGKSSRKARPWLGMYTQESDGNLIVGGVSPDGPADQAGVQEGDLVLGVAGNRAHTLAEFFRMIWKQGPAGVDVPLSLARQGDVLRVIVKSADRNDFLKKPEVH